MIHQRFQTPSSIVTLLCVVLAWFSAAPVSLRAAEQAAAPLFTISTRAAVAPGVVLSSIHYADERGPVTGTLLTIDLANPAISTRLLTPGTLATAQPLSRMVASSGAVAAVNGDFFDIDHTSAPYGVAVQDGTLLKGPIYSWTRAVGVGSDGVGRLAEMSLGGALRFGGSIYPLAALNQHNIPVNSIGMYTSAWGSAARGRAVECVEQLREVVVQNGKVVATSDTAGAGPIGPDTWVLLGREDAATTLDKLNIGDTVEVRYRANTDAAAPFRFALGGKEILLRDGAIQPVDATRAEPRTAVGFSDDGHTMWLATIDGRQRDSRGLTLRDLATLMQQVGAVDAINLDGGGSTTMLAREAGAANPAVVNRPSNGVERPVPNGIGIFVKPGSGVLAGLRAFPAADDNATAVFAGLSRTLATAGYDDMYGPATASSLDWQSLTPTAGSIDGSGVFRAGVPGAAQIRAQAPGTNGSVVSATLGLQVLGPVAQLQPGATAIVLPLSTSTTLSVRGSDAKGNTALIDTHDIRVGYDTSVIDVVALDAARLEIKPRAAGATTLTIAAGGIVTKLPVSVGVRTVPVPGIDQHGNWTFASNGSTGSVGAGTGRTGAALHLTYAFDRSTNTRTAAALASTPIALPGRPLQLRMWVLGTGKAEQSSVTVRTANGQTVEIAGPLLNSTDWQQIAIDIPQTLQFPVQLAAISVGENDPTKQYQGELTIDSLDVLIPTR